MKNFAALVATLMMGTSAYLAVPHGAKPVGAEEAASVWGAQNCVQQGSVFTLCTLNQSCNPNVIPPVTGWATYNNNGTPTTQCYKPGQGTVYCPCGSTGYFIYGTSSASCFVGS